MKVIVGLGNPGLQYEQTRHNAGFMVVDVLAARHARGAIAKSRFSAATLEASVRGEKCLLMKPTTFMNLSGRSVAEAARFFKVSPEADVIVVVDDLALPVGGVRVRASGGSGGHNGLADIEQKLGTAGYPRVRVGIGAKPALMVQADWVLSRFTAEEKGELDRSLREAADAVEAIIAEGLDAAMNRFNKKVGAEEKPRTHPKEQRPRDGAGRAGDGTGRPGDGAGRSEETAGEGGA